jgi:hypothetical protein
LTVAGALRVDADGRVVVVPENVPTPEMPERPLEILGVRL